MIAEVPTMAVHICYVENNNSCLHDEFLIQRLCLVPFISEQIDDFNIPYECDCAEWCDKCRVEYKISAVCKDFSKNITSDDFELVSDHPFVKPVVWVKEPRYLNIYLNFLKLYRRVIPIVELRKGQEIHLRAFVCKGFSQLHAKWSPVSKVVFKPEIALKFNEKRIRELNIKQKMELVESCPYKIFKLNTKTEMIDIEDAQKCTLCGECKKKAEEINPNTKLIQAEQKLPTTTYNFEFESIGMLSPQFILSKALDILLSKIGTLESCIQEISDKNMQ